MRNRNVLKIGLLAVALGFAPAWAGPLGTEITYQGQLQDNGAPASGTADIRATLWDAVSGGAQVGGAVETLGVSVSDGLFTLPMDFGAAAFTGDARWMEIEVRLPAGVGGYTTLTPRQPLTAAPYAMHALSGGPWQTSGSAIVNTNTGFVGINRTTPITGAEVFGISSDLAGFGGMYIKSPVGGLPFYGYSDSSSLAYHYYDGATGKWHLNVLGDSLTVEGNTGNVGIGTQSPQAKLHITGAAGVDGIMFPDGTLQTTAGGGGSGFWQANGTAIANTNTGFVGINRTTQVSGAEAFGVYKDTTSFGGMYVQTQVGGLPFYGYNNDGGSFSAFHYVEGVGNAGKWFLNVGNLNRLAVDPTGNVGVGTDFPQAKLHVGGTAGVDGVMFPDGTLQTSAFGLWNANGADIVNANAGNVGIGTASPPASRLQVEGGGGAQSQGQIHVVGNGQTIVGDAYISFYEGAEANSTWAVGLDDSTDAFVISHGLDMSNPRFTISEVSGNVSIPGEVTTTAVNLTSDRNAKEQFEPVDPRAVLDKVLNLPISEWQYKTHSDARHIGPMAQDFRAAFALGRDDKHIATVDADGIALAAIQGLNQKLEDKEAELMRLRSENQALAERLAAIERALNLTSESVSK